jgi:photosystem II stability/assembly factor-like uncharacterized protein
MNDDELIVWLRRTLHTQAAAVRTDPAPARLAGEDRPYRDRRPGPAPRRARRPGWTPPWRPRWLIVAPAAVFVALAVVVAFSVTSGSHSTQVVTSEGTPAAPGTLSQSNQLPPHLPAAAVPAAGSGVPPAFDPASVTFVSTHSGWVLGTAGCGPVRCLVLLHTADSGRTWTTVGTPQPPGGLASIEGSGSLGLRVRFGNLRDGWIYQADGRGSLLWATHDGGQQWSTPTLADVGPGATVADLEMANKVVTVAVRDAGAIKLETTPVGQDAWQPAVTLPTVAGPAPGGQIILYEAAGWFMENDGGAVAGARLKGGQVWTTWEPPCAANGGSGLLAASTRTDLVAVCTAGAGPSVRLYASGDGGGAFKEVAGPVPVAAVAAVTSPTPGTVVAAAMQSGPDTDVARLVATFDAGATWRQVFAKKRSSGWAELGFTNSSQGVAIARGADGLSSLLMTFDGGYAWQAVNFRSAVRGGS